MSVWNRFFSKTRNWVRGRKAKALLVCLLFSVLFWMLLTLFETYEYTFHHPITFSFEEKDCDLSYRSTDEIDVTLIGNGVDLLYHQWFERNKPVNIVLSKSLLNTKSGRAHLDVSTLRESVGKTFRLKNAGFSVYPDTIDLMWQKTVSKRLRVVSRVNVQTIPPYRLYSDLEFEPTHVFVEGRPEVLDTLTTIYTQPVRLSGVETSCHFLVALQPFPKEYGVRIRMPIVFCKVNTEPFTEETIEIPIRKIQGNELYEVKLFPDVVKITYRVALKDFESITPDSFDPTVTIDETMFDKRYMKVNLETHIAVPYSVQIQPEKVEYMIFR